MPGYRLSRRAEKDLIEIYVSGVQAFGLDQAETYQDGLEAAFDLIARYPEIARERRELDPPVRVHRYRSHLVIYLAGPGGVLIVRVRHGREDWEISPGGDEARFPGQELSLDYAEIPQAGIAPPQPFSTGSTRKWRPSRSSISTTQTSGSTRAARSI